MSTSESIGVQPGMFASSAAIFSTRSWICAPGRNPQTVGRMARWASIQRDGAPPETEPRKTACIGAGAERAAAAAAGRVVLEGRKGTALEQESPPFLAVLLLLLWNKDGTTLGGADTYLGLELLRHLAVGHLQRRNTGRCERIARAWLLGEACHGLGNRREKRGDERRRDTE